MQRFKPRCSPRLLLYMMLGFCSMVVFLNELRGGYFITTPRAALQAITPEKSPPSHEIDIKGSDYGTWQLPLPCFADEAQAERLLKCTRKDGFMASTFANSKHLLRGCAEPDACSGAWESLAPTIVRGTEEQHLLMSFPRFHEAYMVYAHNAKVSRTNACSRWTIDKNMSHDGVFSPSDEIPSIDLAIYLYTEEGGAFQHFLDGLLPKLVYALQWLTPEERGKAVLMLPGLRNDVLHDVIKRLGFENNRVISAQRGVSAKKWLFPCLEPLRHPSIWRQMHDLILRGDQYDFSSTRPPPTIHYVPADKYRNIIVYFSRSGSDTRNPGRRVVNEIELLKAIDDLLKQRNKGERLVVFERNSIKPPGLEGYLKFFGRAKALIGPHGGGFYNMWFTPPGAFILEFFPLETRCAYPALGSFWYHAAMFGHRYGMLFPDKQARAEDMTINIEAVTTMLTRHLSL